MTQNKMLFYNSVKQEFGYEPYLDISDSRCRQALSRLRSSAHDLKVETGRYQVKGKRPPSLADKSCRVCCNNEVLKELEHLPGFETIIEDESHVITTCPKYHQLRSRLSNELKSHIMLHDFKYIMSEPQLVKEFGIYLHGCFKLRNPTKN